MMKSNDETPAKKPDGTQEAPLDFSGAPTGGWIDADIEGAVADGLNPNTVVGEWGRHIHTEVMKSLEWEKSQNRDASESGAA